MKNNLNRLLRIISSFVLIAGVFSKHLHYPGASIEIIFSIALIVIITGIDCIVKKDKFNMLMGLSLCVMFVGALFKVQHWPGASTLAGFGVGLSIAITLIMSLRKENAQLSEQNGLSVFLLLILVVTLMQNNPLKILLENDEKKDTVVDTRIFGTWLLDTALDTTNTQSLERMAIYAVLDSGELLFQKDSVCTVISKKVDPNISHFYLKGDTMILTQDAKFDTLLVRFVDNDHVKLNYTNSSLFLSLKRK